MISLIYETKDFIAVDKPAGVLVHEVPSIKHRYQEKKLWSIGF